MEAADKAYFDGIPWCAKLLANPNITIEVPESRKPKASTEDALFAEVLQTPDTIKACLTFHDRPANDCERIEQLDALVSLGYAVNGYPHIAHGGLVATLVDEFMGLLLHVNKLRGTIPSLGPTVTAYLNVSYLKPVATPQTVQITITFKEVLERKNFIQATVKDGCGTLLVRAESLFIQVGQKEEKL